MRHETGALSTLHYGKTRGISHQIAHLKAFRLMSVYTDSKVFNLRFLQNEEVEWTTRKGFFSLSLFLAFLGTVVPGAFLAMFGFIGGSTDGQRVQPNPIFGWIGVVLILIGLGYTAISIMAIKSTQYILTNQRIVEARSDKIAKEIPLANFMGKPISQFVDKQTAGTVNEQPVFNVRITDPKSLDFIELKSLNQKAVETLEEILERARQVVRCKYCNTNNSATSFVCSRCTAPLL